MAQGSRGQLIFAGDLDRKLWLEILGEAGEKTGRRLHACVLMANPTKPHFLQSFPALRLPSRLWRRGPLQNFDATASEFCHPGQPDHAALGVGQGGDVEAFQITAGHVLAEVPID